MILDQLKREFEAAKKLGLNIGKLMEGIPLGMFKFFEKYFRLEIEGLENIPEDGNGLIVGNHSDAFGFDAFMLMGAIITKTNRNPMTMTHKFWFYQGILHGLARSFRLFPADLKEGLNTLKQGNLVVIFPEGADGNFKISSNMYKLVDFNPGFVPLAIMQRAPVIPVVIIGAEETHINLATIHEFTDLFGAPLPIPLNIIPLPAKWKIKFLKPIDFSKYNKKDIKDARFVKEINQNIRYRLQHEIDKHVKNRDIVYINRRRK